MKKLIFATAILLFALTSCEKTEYIYQNDIQAILINVSRSDWQYSDSKYQYDGHYFFATADVPEITESVLKTGMVKMYRVYDFGTRDEAQIELPYVHHNEEDNGEDWDFYTETIDYEFQKGMITIFYTMSNFKYEDDEDLNPDPMQFRLVIMQ